MKHNEGFLALVNDAKSRVKQIGIDQYKEMPREGHLLIDVREDNESKVPDKSATLVLYCGGGFRSALVADALQKMGYENPISLDGGWRAWNQAGLPVEKKR